MSYDFWLEIDTGGAEPYRITPYFSDRHPVLDVEGHAGNVLVTPQGYVRTGNYTSNVGGIWAKCLEAGYGAPTWLSDLDGRSCAELAPGLLAAVGWGVEHIAELEPMNQDNGWGDARGAVTYLWDIQRLCEAHPKAVLRFWY